MAYNFLEEEEGGGKKEEEEICSLKRLAQLILTSEISISCLWFISQLVITKWF
jgi:hypothetical protein